MTYTHPSQVQHMPTRISNRVGPNFFQTLRQPSRASTVWLLSVTSTVNQRKKKLQAVLQLNPNDIQQTFFLALNHQASIKPSHHSTSYALVPSLAAAAPFPTRPLERPTSSPIPTVAPPAYPSSPAARRKHGRAQSREPWYATGQNRNNSNEKSIRRIRHYPLHCTWTPKTFVSTAKKEWSEKKLSINYIGITISKPCYFHRVWNNEPLRESLREGV